MSDEKSIVEKLRIRARWPGVVEDPLLEEAADIITDLRTALEEARTFLVAWAHTYDVGVAPLDTINQVLTRLQTLQGEEK